ncbi:uncharacterized protein [Amphiura filiformis]|uniref:uncharacterized protein n=1 Tax=Amphiura filiformis TaxID=82378 RepID=UPI003B21385F
MIKRYESTLAARTASIDDGCQAACRLCFVQRGLADNTVQECQDCNTPVCQMCGSFTASEEKSSKQNEAAARWRCKICELKREYLCVTGRWYHAHSEGKTSNPISLNISTQQITGDKEEDQDDMSGEGKDGYASSLDGKRPPQLQVHRCDSVDTTALQEREEDDETTRPDTAQVKERRLSRCFDEGDMTGKFQRQRSRSSIRRRSSVLTTNSARSHSPREHRRASFDVPRKRLSPPPMLTRGSSERSRSRSSLKSGPEFQRRASSASPYPSRTPSIQRRCSTRRRRSAASDIQMMYRHERDDEGTGHREGM